MRTRLKYSIKWTVSSFIVHVNFEILAQRSGRARENLSIVPRHYCCHRRKFFMFS